MAAPRKTATNLTPDSIMTKDVIHALLHKGSTGAEILQILDAIADGSAAGESDASAGEPTINAIEF